MTIYFAQQADAPNSPIKIGVSADLGKRMKTLSAGSPVPLNVLASVAGGRRLETALHKLFEDDRLHGEWFEPSSRLNILIEDIASHGGEAVPDFAEDEVASPQSRISVIKDEASAIVKYLGREGSSSKEQINVASAKTGLSSTIIARLRYKKSDRVYADIMDTLRAAERRDRNAERSALGDATTIAELGVARSKSVAA